MTKSESESRSQDPRVSVVPDPLAKMACADAGISFSETDAESKGEAMKPSDDIKFMVETVCSEVLDPPCVQYVRELDFLLFLREDCSYSAAPVHQYLDVLWHPYEVRLVGVKIHACAMVFGQIKKAMRLPDDAKIRLASVLEIIRLGWAATSPLSYRHLERLHQAALQCASEFEVSLLGIG